MIANWVHIMIVHIAVLGTPWALYRVLNHKAKPLDSIQWKNTFSGLIVLGIIVSISYLTGPQAADWTKTTVENYSQDQVENHALWARVAFVIQGIVALLGIMGWSSILQEEKPDSRITIVLTILLILNTLVMVYAAHLGGLIRRMDLLY